MTQPIVSRLFCAVAGILMFSSAPAFAITVSNAAHTFSFVRDCRSAASRALGSTVPDKCEASGDFSSTKVEETYDGNYGGLVASNLTTSTLASSGLDQTRSYVDASGALGVLTIKQGAFTSLPYARVSSHSEALQSYSWDGLGSSNRTLNAAINFTATDLIGKSLFDTSGDTAASFVTGTVRVFSLLTASFDVTPSAEFQNFSDQAFLTGAGYQLEASFDSGDVLGSPLSNNLNFNLQTGRYYFIDSYLGLWAKFGASIDATHTFTTTIGDMTGLTAASPSDQPLEITNKVPEPASLTLSLLGLCALIAVSRRRKGSDTSSPFFS